MIAGRLAATALLGLSAVLAASSAFAQVPIPEQPPCRANENGLQCFERIIADQGHELRAKFLLSRQRWCRFYALIDGMGREAREEIGRLCRPAGMDMDAAGMKLSAAASGQQGLVELAERESLGRAADLDLASALKCKAGPTGIDVFQAIPFEMPICHHLVYQMECYEAMVRLSRTGDGLVHFTRRPE